MNSRQRNFLRSLAVNVKPIVTIGKGGLSPSLIQEVQEVLDNRELVKITVLKNSTLNPQQVLDELSKIIIAEPVACIGNKIIMYRRSPKKDIEHIKLPQ